MLKSIGKRLLAAAIMAAMVLVSLSPATVQVEAQEVYVRESRVVENTVTSDCAVEKHETVYVNLAANGAVQQVNVSAWRRQVRRAVPDNAPTTHQNGDGRERQRYKSHQYVRQHS